MPFVVPNPHTRGTLRWHAWNEGYIAAIVEIKIAEVMARAALAEKETK